VALYHCSITALSRADGRSAVAAAAYRASAALHDARTGLTHDYRRKQGVRHSVLVLPEDAPAWAQEREVLWNAAEAAERVNGRPARDLEFALPHELALEAQAALAEAVARHVVARYGAAVDLNLHAPPRRGDPRNGHAHLLMSTRRLGADGFGKKARALDDRRQGPEEIRHLRRMVAGLTNRFLAQANLEARVDHRSLAAQGIERTPTQHEGPRVRAMARRGVLTERAAANASLRLRHGVEAFAPLSAEAAPEAAPAQPHARSAKIRPVERHERSGGHQPTRHMAEAPQAAILGPESAIQQWRSSPIRHVWQQVVQRLRMAFNAVIPPPTTHVGDLQAMRGMTAPLWQGGLPPPVASPRGDGGGRRIDASPSGPGPP
jgi:hypothetical protein